MRRILALLVSLSAVVATSSPMSDKPVRIAVTAELAPAMRDLMAEFRRETNRNVEFTVGAGPALARRIASQGGFDAFVAADPRDLATVLTGGKCDRASTVEIARGRIALYVSPNARVAPPRTLSSLVAGEYAHIAVPDETNDPYGRAAQQAFGDSGVLDALTPRLVRGAGVAQTLDLADSNRAEAALVPWSLVKERTTGHVVLLDAGMHAPIAHTAVACTGGRATEGGRALVGFLGGPSAARILQPHGFDPAGGPPPP